MQYPSWRPSTSRRLAEGALLATVSIAALYFWDQRFGPIPVPAATLVAAGLAAAVIPDSLRGRRIAAACGAGLLVGVGVHFLVHAMEGRLAPEDGVSVPRHLAVDALAGMLIGAAVLVPLLTLTYALRRRPIRHGRNAPA